MNKKGFTLIELIVSIVLVSVVMVSLLASLVKIRDTYSVVYANTDALIYSSSISRIINNDLANSGGIRYINCDVDGNVCNMVLGDDSKRRLEIKSVEIGTLVKNENGSIHVDGDVNKKLKASDKIYCESKPINCKTAESGDISCDCGKKIVANTLSYVDTTENTEKLIYIKTLSMKKITVLEGDSESIGRVSTDGYIFGKMYTDSIEFDSANKFVAGIPYVNVLTTLNVEIYDGIDNNDTSFNISISSASSYRKDLIKTGDIIKLPLVNDILGAVGISINSPYEELVIKYGVGFYVYEIEDTVNGIVKKLTKITSLPSVPIVINGTQIFDGYYYLTKDVDEFGVEYDAEVDVVDATGKILIPNTQFTDKTKLPTLYARWK